VTTITLRAESGADVDAGAEGADEAWVEAEVEIGGEGEVETLSF
jgi:hypothetical protein